MGLITKLYVQRAYKIIYVVYLPINMLFCALVFAPWIQPRETVSGLLGRWLVDGCRWQVRFARIVAPTIDGWHEPGHCVETFRLEKAMRVALYGKPYYETD